MAKRYLLSLVAACGVMWACVATAQAETPAPGWELYGFSDGTNLAPGGIGRIELMVYNVGEGAGEGPTVTVTLPPGLVAESGQNGEATCTGTPVVVCKVTYPILPTGLDGSDGVRVIRLRVKVEADASNAGNPEVHATATGGGALTSTSTSFPIKYSSANPGFGFSGMAEWAGNANGTLDTQAGSHPDNMTVIFSLNSIFNPEGSAIAVGGEMHYIDVNLPPGVVADPTATVRCTRAQFDNEECPAASRIGEDVVGFISSPAFPFPVYNMVPPPGYPAEFGFDLGGISTFLDSYVRSGGDSGITVRGDAPQRRVFLNATTIWGIPSEHNGSGGPPTQFLTLPTSCGAPLEFSAEVTGTWQNENTKVRTSSFLRNNEFAPVGMTGCQKLLHFEPQISIAPDTSYSDSPAGLTTSVKVPQEVNPEGLGTSGLKETVVTLPEGIVINPGQATGLGACQTWQENLGGEGQEYDGPPNCPADSQVGTDEISTPLLANRLKGNVYILQKNPPEVELLVAASGEGVNLKLVGKVHLNETTGQLVTTFNGTPEAPGTPDAPLNEFKLSFSGGAQAALVTPSTCGVYSSNAVFSPWSAPFVGNFQFGSSFAITSGPNGSGTAACTGPLPFTPTMTAGATTDQAGGYTDFTMQLARADGQQRMEKLQFKAPEGQLGMLSKVPLCPEPQAAQGTCSAASQIGHTIVEVGPGPYPFVIPENNAPPAPIYLTGPYGGAPFGLSIVVPVVAGPFNLGTEVVRGKIEIDPHTAQLTISTTPFPKTVKGIPADIRLINAVIDRPEFMFNPTSCAPMSFSGTAYSFEGATAPLSSHFQMGSCRSLKFQPNFTVSTSGKTSRTQGASLTAKIVYPTGNLGANQASSQSNINSVKVDLPKQLPSRLTTLQKACTAATFEANPANCPAASKVGFAKAITPELPVPLEGPAYFVSHASEEFPSLIAVLQGYGVTIDLVGSTFIDSKTNITSSTFKKVPDVPIGSFELTLPEGPYSALAANGNLCKTKLEMPTAFVAQNGATLHKITPISVTGCPKQKAKKKSVKHKSKAHTKKKK
jgi:hypothetical protein